MSGTRVGVDMVGLNYVYVCVAMVPIVLVCSR